MTNEAMIQAVFQDETFVKGLFELETPEEVQAALRGRDVEVSVDEIRQVRELLVKRMEKGEELTDEELEGVAGGVICIAGGTLLLLAAMSGVIAAMAVGGGGVIGILATQMATNGKW